MRHLLNIFLFIGPLMISQVVFSQTDTTKTEPQKMLVVKNDGAKYIGYILSDDGREILLETEAVGKLYIPKHLIQSISKYDPNKVEEPKQEESEVKEESKEVSYEDWRKRKFNNDIEYEYKNYTSTKYIQSDNAYPLRKGEAFIKFMPVGLEAQLPVTKNWSIGAVSTYIGAPFALKSKISFPLADSSYLALDFTYGSMLFGSYMGVDERNGGGYGGITYTFGDRQRNFSAKLGYALVHEYWEEWIWDDINGTIIEVGGEMAYNQFAFANFGSMLQITERTALVMDFLLAYGNMNSWGTNSQVFVAAASVAARFGPNPHHRFQLGGSLFTYDSFFIPVPVPNISYTYVFPKRNP